MHKLYEQCFTSENITSDVSITERNYVSLWACVKSNEIKGFIQQTEFIGDLLFSFIKKKKALSIL